MWDVHVQDILEDILQTYRSRNFAELRYWAKKVLKILRNPNVSGDKGLVVRAKKGPGAFVCHDLVHFITEGVKFTLFLVVFMAVNADHARAFCHSVTFENGHTDSMVPAQQIR